VWYEGADLTDPRYLHADERGSIIATSYPDGSIRTVQAYDDYGVPQNTSLTQTGRFGYTGQAWLPEVGLYNYKARMYGPHLGRFFQIDPIGYLGGMNLQAYVRNDPVNFTDPLGLQEEDLPGPVVTGDRCSQVACIDLTTLVWVMDGGTASCNLLGCDFNPEIVVTGRRNSRRTNAAVLPIALALVGVRNILGDPDAFEDACGSTGTERVPDSVGGVNLSGACRRHDRCYSFGPSKADCDKQLFTDVRRACRLTGAGPIQCNALGSAYYFGVTVLGGDAYRSARLRR
jgi:RHS repeat-associated protein